MKKHLLFLVSLLCSFNFIAQTPIEFDIIQGATSSDPYYIKEINNNLYFYYDAPDANGNYKVGYINNAGEIVKPFYELPIGFEINDSPDDTIVELNGKIYFIQDFYDSPNGDDYYARLMELDNDTVRIINSDIDEEIYGLTKFNNKLYFDMYTDTTGWELFSFDGTNFTQENDIVAGTNSGDPWNFKVLNNQLHFTSVDWTNNKIIFYRTNGSTYLTDTLHNYLPYYEIKTYYINNEYIYLGGIQGYGGAIIHTNDNDSLALVKYGSNNISNLGIDKSIEYNGNIIIGSNYYTDFLPKKILRYDVANDTLIVLNAENTDVDYVNDFALYNNEVYLTGSISPLNGYPYLGKVDIVNDTVITQNFTNQNGPIEYMKSFENNLYFRMDDINFGKEPFKLVGNSTQLISDLYTGNNGSYPYEFFSFNGNVGFVASVDNGDEIYIMCSNTSLPTAPATQIACEKSIISDLNVTGTNLSYHTASTGGAVLNENAQLLASGSIYVASNIICPSTRIEVPFTISMLPNTAAAYLGDSLVTVINPTTSYQWIDCANDQNINGATSQTFKAPGNGSYKCLLTNQDGCKIETNCIYIINLSINENEMNQTKVYPNPTFDILHIDSYENMKSLTLKSINGATVHSSAVNAMQHTIDVSTLSEGIYFLEILNESNVVISKQKVIVKK